MRFNINSPVRVRLTAKGRDYLRSAHNAFYLPKEDENGWSDWQLWTLMQAFGPHVGPGFDNMFETEIEIVEMDQVND